MSDFISKALAKNNQNKIDALEKNMNDKLLEKAAKSDINAISSSLSTKVDKTYLDSQINSNLSSKADKTYVDTQIGNIGNASPKGTYADLASLQAAYPTGTTGVYVVASDGKWYYWNGSAWTAGGIYQATGIADETVTLRKLNLPYVNTIQNIVKDSYKTAHVGVTKQFTNITGSLNAYASNTAPNAINLSTGYYFMFADFDYTVTGDTEPTAMANVKVGLKSISGGINLLSDMGETLSEISNVATVKSGVSSANKLCVMLQITSANSYYPILQFNGLGSTAFNYDIKFNNIALIRVGDSLESKQKYYEYVKLYGVIDRYPILNLTETQMKQIGDKSNRVDSLEKDFSLLNPYIEQTTNLKSNFSKDIGIATTITSASTLVNLNRVATTYSSDLDTGYYFVMMKMTMNAPFSNSTSVRPMLRGIAPANAHKYQDDTSNNLPECPTSRFLKDGMNSFEMCSILNVQSPDTYVLGAYMTNHVGGDITFTIEDATIIKLPDSNDLNASKKKYYDLVKSSGYVQQYKKIKISDTSAIEKSVTSHETRIQVLEKNVKTLDYWGDSLTAGNQDGTGVTRPSVMQSLLGNGWVVNNYGAGGEQSNTIAARQGGLNFVVKPTFTIPADTSPVNIDIVDNDGGIVNIRSSVSNGSINPCYIAGVKGTLSGGSTYGASPYVFTRETAGSAVVVDRPTGIITNGMKVSKDNPIIIFMGQNGGYNSDSAELVKQIQQMIEINTSKKYLVISLTTSAKDSQNSAMKKAFGRHFVDARSYLIQYGLQDAGITPTAEDTTAIANNLMPPSLCVSDGLHFNRYGYTVIAKLEFKRGNELGYW